MLGAFRTQPSVGRPDLATDYPMESRNFLYLSWALKKEKIELWKKDWP